jgi:hypothetical protein
MSSNRSGKRFIGLMTDKVFDPKKHLHPIQTHKCPSCKGTGCAACHGTGKRRYMERPNYGSAQRKAPKKKLGPCICDGKKHWHGSGSDKILRTNWKTNPYCKAHEDETKTTD